MGYAKTVPYLVAELAKMDVDRIRAVMVHEDITGKLGDPCACIVAQYLGVKTGRVVSAYPLAGITWFDRDADNALVKVGTLPTPESLIHFMNAFDHGLYPELISWK